MPVSHIFTIIPTAWLRITGLYGRGRGPLGGGAQPFLPRQKSGGKE